MRGAIPPLPQHVFMEWLLIKHRDNFTFYLYKARWVRWAEHVACTGEMRSAYKVSKSRGSSVGIALGYGVDDWGSRVRFPAGAGNFSLHHRVQNGSGTPPPASYPMGAGGSFLGGKAAGA
jgi:hypothetical protein